MDLPEDHPLPIPQLPTDAPGTPPPTFALINRPDIFDLRPGNSFVEFLLEQGFDVFLVDWGYADEEDADTGLDDYALEYIPRAIREVRRASGAEEITLVGWCIGAALTGMIFLRHPGCPGPQLGAVDHAVRRCQHHVRDLAR